MNNTQMDDGGINDARKHRFHPEHEETPHHRAVRLHYGRYRFATYWRVEQDLNREWVKYMWATHRQVK